MVGPYQKGLGEPLEKKVCEKNGNGKILWAAPARGEELRGTRNNSGGVAGAKDRTKGRGLQTLGDTKSAPCWGSGNLTYSLGAATNRPEGAGSTTHERRD